VTPWGDKCITEDLITNYVETSNIKKKVLSLYCCFSYYCKKIGLDIIDGCFMLDSKGETVWSEINPDCMRVKKNELNSRENYDKDIWRIGGSASKDKIL
jgi:phosphoribosylaminoimidazole-succinocarboxamide synthase